MEIIRMSAEKYKIKSNSGKIYNITYAGSGDADPEYVALWECNCPGYKYRGNCKHMTEFLDSAITNDEDEEENNET